MLGVTIGAAETLIDDPRCPEAATLVTDGVHLALYDHHAVCIGRFIMIVHPVLQEGVRISSTYQPCHFLTLYGMQGVGSRIRNLGPFSFGYRKRSD